MSARTAQIHMPANPKKPRILNLRIQMEQLMMQSVRLTCQITLLIWIKTKKGNMTDELTDRQWWPNGYVMSTRMSYDNYSMKIPILIRSKSGPFAFFAQMLEYYIPTPESTFEKRRLQLPTAESTFQIADSDSRLRRRILKLPTPTHDSGFQFIRL